MSADPIEWYRSLARRLLLADTVHRGEWQAMDVSGSERHSTYELMDVTIRMAIPDDVSTLVDQTNPHLPWADEHFAERVGGKPLNPPPSHKIWPWARHNAEHQDTDNLMFSHTYPERFWPKYAGNNYPDGYDTSRNDPRRGIRYAYGDLSDVVNLLVNRPMTRQAFLPVWFPEDTGSLDNVRVPCTIGYHFMVRAGRLHCWYPMRSCDLIRHLPDDVYLAGRLMQWMVDRVKRTRLGRGHQPGCPHWTELMPGRLHMTISSLHAFVGDKWALERIVEP